MTEQPDIYVDGDATEVVLVEEVVDVGVVVEEVAVSVEDDSVVVEVDDHATEVLVADESVEILVAEGPPGPSAVSADDGNVASIGSDGLVYVPEGAKMSLDVEVDEASPTVTYVGEALPGTAVGTSQWRIKRVTDSGSAVSIDWAGGTSDFVHVWTARASLTYGP